MSILDDEPKVFQYMREDMDSPGNRPPREPSSFGTVLRVIVAIVIIAFVISAISGVFSNRGSSSVDKEEYENKIESYENQLRELQQSYDELQDDYETLQHDYYVVTSVDRYSLIHDYYGEICSYIENLEVAFSNELSRCVGEDRADDIRVKISNDLGLIPEPPNMD